MSPKPPVKFSLCFVSKHLATLNENLAIDLKSLLGLFFPGNPSILLLYVNQKLIRG